MLSKKEELGLDINKKPVNIQEEYFKLQNKVDLDDWDYVRVPRPNNKEENFFGKQ
ncbi:hypothetical protein HDU92_008541 [Lobulomyces angularis]|nr:hypothetical protein HDU92_008541 [Lobulomyces angularis]